MCSLVFRHEPAQQCASLASPVCVFECSHFARIFYSNILASDYIQVTTFPKRHSSDYIPQESFGVAKLKNKIWAALVCVGIYTKSKPQTLNPKP